MRKDFQQKKKQVIKPLKKLTIATKAAATQGSSSSNKITKAKTAESQKRFEQGKSHHKRNS